MVTSLQNHLCVVTNSRSEAAHNLRGKVKGCLKLAGILSGLALHPSTDFGRVRKVTDKQETIGLDVAGDINQLVNECHIVQWHLQVRYNEPRLLHGKIITEGSKRMQPEIKQQWIDALRSGEYRQGKYALRRGESYCCLGVLSELAVKAGVIDQAKPDIIGWIYDQKWHSLPKAVSKWADISASSATGTTCGILINMNDGGDRSFEEIADWIEENL
jgi:hypothetical protein